MNISVRPPKPVPQIPSPRDEDFPGTIALFVDATDLDRGIFEVTERIPVSRPGPMTLLYPKWVPGYHSPQAPIELVAGLDIRGAGVRIEWRRDPVEMYAFHLDVPFGCDLLEVRFQFLSPPSSEYGRVVVTRSIVNLQWHCAVLYPAGYYASRITVEPSVRLPAGWRFGCSLETQGGETATATFAPVPLDVLIDSPIMAGEHFTSHDLDETGTIRLNLVADRPGLLDAGGTRLETHRNLIAQADKLFRSRHFRHYDFLVALTEELEGTGVEHQQSCEICTAPDYFTAWDKQMTRRDVIAHEYVHTWNGKFQRGADSWVPSFEIPIRNSLMWVYEGQTQYWGQVLAARSGLWTLEQALGSLALTASMCALRCGRRWRAMSDTTRDPIISERDPRPWPSWQRNEDYYSDGQLLWLEVDTLVRELSAGAATLDDFAARFFGKEDGRRETLLYVMEDVVRTLEGIAAHDWAGFFDTRLNRIGESSYGAGIERGGYHIVFRDHPSEFHQGWNASSGLADFTFSLGLTVGSGGEIGEVIWDSAAFEAALTPGAKILAVNGRGYGADHLRQAIVAAGDGKPIELVVRKGPRVRSVQVQYEGGLRYPHLEPIEGKARLLDRIYASR
jgi:predicted metalloprotease with PDZ domain